MYFCSAETWDSGLWNLWLIIFKCGSMQSSSSITCIIFFSKDHPSHHSHHFPFFSILDQHKENIFSQPRHMQHPSECVRADPLSARGITVLVWSLSCPAAQNKLGITTHFFILQQRGDFSIVLPNKHFPFMYLCPFVGKHPAPPLKLWQLSDWPEALAILYGTMTWNQTSLLQIISE